ncbi:MULTISPECIES: hypothetical protein [unclassified Streptococcus]|uniref:hypothetical protein n=1 Tax=unclassified Streptococcus TaxID=2608887 RepID=UPI00359E700E
MKKQLLSLVVILILAILRPYLLKIPVLGPLYGFLEFLTIALIIGYILYHIGLHIYLWVKVRKKD